MKNWDYDCNHVQFIFIYSHNSRPFFGKISNAEMKLNEIGKLAEQFWFSIKIYFPFVEFDNFVIMPNQVHGVLIINKTNNDTGMNNGVETRLIASLPTDGKIKFKKKWISEYLG